MSYHVLEFLVVTLLYFFQGCIYCNIIFKINLFGQNDTYIYTSMEYEYEVDCIHEKNH